MENENKDALSSEKSPKNQPLQLLQHNDAKFIACDLRSRDLVKCRSCLTPFCEKPIKVYHNSRNYLACSIKRSLSENSTRSLPTNGSLKPNKKLSKSLRHWYDYQGCASLCKTSKKVIKGIRLSVLIEHNKYRKLHGAGPLKMDYQLSIYAQEWADVGTINRLEFE
uniref:Uncharacterized protein LOC108039715 n=1 Tax=Drosophila rhopaloa TaxID=1041015 RepID=A0A6P4E2S7_DRORH